MTYIKPGTLVVTPINPTDRDALTFTFVASLDDIDTTRLFGTTIYVMYKPHSYGDAQYLSLPGGSAFVKEQFNFNQNNITFSITVNEPALVSGSYDFLVVDKIDYDQAQPYNTNRVAKAIGIQILPYSAPIQNPVRITIIPTPADAAVTIDSIPRSSGDFSAGTTILLSVSKYGYRRYSASITLKQEYAGQTVVMKPVLEPCGVTDPTCTGYVEPITEEPDLVCDSGDLICQYKPYLPYLAIGAVIIFMMMQQQPRESQQPVIIKG